MAYTSKSSEVFRHGGGILSLLFDVQNHEKYEFSKRCKFGSRGRKGMGDSAKDIYFF